jgi:hypothetical protein
MQSLWRPLGRAITTCAIALTLLPLTSTIVSAQSVISSTDQLKQACETSAGNTILINYDASINTGAPVNVATGCTINLTADAEIGFDKVSVNFAGPLVINGANKGGVKLQDSVVSASAVTVNFKSTNEAFFQANNGKLQATAGNLYVDIGFLAKMEVKGQQAGGTFVASGTVNLTGEQKLSIALTEVNVQAGNGLIIFLNGSETLLKIEKSTLQTALGNLNITGRYSKSVGEIFGSTLTAGGELNLDYAQVQSSLLLTENTLQSGGRTILAGGSVFGLNKVSGGSVTAGGPVLIWNGSSVNGEVSVDKVNISAVGNLTISSSSNSKTSVKDSTLTTTAMLTIVSSVGVCETANNTVSSASYYICGVTSY